ncbi:MAG: ABC transporter ATP-binding protein, partial [Verrucomicrobiaceae bacterium]
AYLADRILVMGTNPGRVVEFIENPIPRPRSPAQFVSPEYLALKLRLEELIHPPVEVEEDKLPVVKMTSAGDDVE